MRKIIFIFSLTLILFLGQDSSALAQLPQGLPNGSPEGTCSGWLYPYLASGIRALLGPIYDFSKNAETMVGVTGDQTGQNLLDCCVVSLFNYLNYFTNFTPMFSFLASLLIFFLLLMTIKGILSLTKWLKQIVPGLG